MTGAGATQEPSSQAAAVLPIPWPAGRSSLYVHELARLWRCTAKHIADLIEEGKLGAVDVAGDCNVFETFTSALAKHLKVKPAAARKALAAAQRDLKPSRRHWRVPQAAYTDFLTRNHSLR